MVRLIDETGAHIGVLSLQEAIEKAREKNLDLIEIQPNASPPVTKIADWSKFLYHQNKVERKKRTKGGKVKEIRFGLAIFEHDLGIKAERAKGFLEKNYKVKVQLVLRRREKELRTKAEEKIKVFLRLLDIPLAFDQKSQKNPSGYTLIVRKSHAKKELPQDESKNEQINSKEVQNNQNRQSSLPSGRD